MNKVAKFMIPEVSIKIGNVILNPMKYKFKLCKKLKPIIAKLSSWILRFQMVNKLNFTSRDKGNKLWKDMLKCHLRF